MEKALGIVTFEDETVNVAGLMDYRPVAAISILGRYRVIDFVLSNFSNSGIDEIKVFVKNQPRSIIGHLNKTNFNLNSKHGKLDIYYGEGRFPQDVYNHDISAFLANMQYIEDSTKPYVILAPSYMLYSYDYNEMIDHHINSGNDITVLYKNSNLGKSRAAFTNCLTLEGDRVVAMGKNMGKYDKCSISLGAYCLSKKLFIELVEKANRTSSLYWFNDIIRDSLKDIKVGGIVFDGYVACINSLESYFNSSMELVKYKISKNLFKKEWPIYTVTNDSCPTLYDAKADVTSSVVANGCEIQGKVINSVIGRNVVIREGAVVENCVILPGAYIGENAKLHCCVVDRHAIVNHVKKLVGSPENPIYVKRRDRI